MEFEWDEAKEAANRAKHGLGFDALGKCDWASAHRQLDDRVDYGEVRRIAYVYLGDRLHVCVYVLRNKRYRIISFRKANRREDRKYGR